MKLDLSLVLIFSLLGFGLSACGSLNSENRMPTFIPEDHLPTAVALTAEALAVSGNPVPTGESDEPPLITKTPFPEPTLTPTPSQTLEHQDPTITPSPTMSVVLEDPRPLALPDPLPYGEIQLISPGALSRVTSPFVIHAFLNPGESRLVQISLYGKDDQLLVRHQQSYQDSSSQRVHLKMNLSFEISGTAEAARLEVSTQDSYGRTAALASTDLILLSSGETDLNPLGDLYENIIIQQPLPSNLIQGESMLVKGFTRRAPGDQVLVEIYNRGGGLVGSKILEVDSEDLGQGYRFFVGDVPITVASSNWVRVQVTARDGRLSGYQHLSSVEVLVSP